MTKRCRHHDGRLWLALALLLGLTSFPLLADDWPQFRGPHRDGRSLETGLLRSWPPEGPPLLWTAEGLGQGFTHVAVANGLVYLTGSVRGEGILHAYTVDGDLAWQANYGSEWTGGHPGARSVPTVHEGLVYVTSGVGNLACFDAATGAPVWSLELFQEFAAPQVQWGYAESLLIDGDHLIATPCGTRATMVALNRKTGELVWASPALGQGSSFCSPLLVERGDQRLIITMTDSAVLAFSAQDGSLLWEYPYRNQRGNHPITPIYHEGLLYVTSGYGKGAVGLALAEDGRSVTPLWEQVRQDPAHGQAVLVDGYVYAASHQSANGRWSCVELETGRLAWEDVAVGRGGSVIYADGLLYCYAEDGTVGLVVPSPERCEVVSSFQLPHGDGSHWAHPVVAGGKLYLRRGNVLMCFDVTDR